MNKKIIAIAILLIISIVTISGCAQKPIEPDTTPVTTPTKSCNTPSDCGSFYDCINSVCVKITPPALP